MTAKTGEMSRRIISDEDILPLEIDERRSASVSSDLTVPAIPKHATWVMAGLLMIADVVGAGVMTLATAFAQLGWVLAFISLVFWYIVAMYVGMLISDCREAWPDADSFMALSERNFGPRAKALTGIALYSFLACILGDYVLMIGECLQMIFYDSEVCPPFWTAVGSLFLLPLSQIRLLALTQSLMILNVITVTLSIVVALGTLATLTPSQTLAFRGNVTIYTEAVAADLDLLTFFHSQALFAFAYMGVFIYLEIISEMKNPKDFKYSLLWLSGPFQFSVYAMAGAWGYSLIGSNASGLLIKQIPPGPAYRCAALLLAIHMVLTFVVKGTILSRAIHLYLFPESAQDFSTPGANKTFFLISLSLLFFCFIFANLIPFFDDLTAFLGALQTPFLGFILPIFFSIKARKVLGSKTQNPELFFMLLIIGFMILLFFLGVATSIKNIADKWSTYGFPIAACLRSE